MHLLLAYTYGILMLTFFVTTAYLLYRSIKSSSTLGLAVSGVLIFAGVLFFAYFLYSEIQKEIILSHKKYHVLIKVNAELNLPKSDVTNELTIFTKTETRNDISGMYDPPPQRRAREPRYAYYVYDSAEVYTSVRERLVSDSTWKLQYKASDMFAFTKTVDGTLLCLYGLPPEHSGYSDSYKVTLSNDIISGDTQYARESARTNLRNYINTHAMCQGYKPN